MASVKEIKEGLLCISWDVGASPNGNGPYHRIIRGQSFEINRTPVNVSTLSDIVDSFTLICKREGQQIVLEIEPPIARKQTKQFELNTIQIHATKDRLQQKMTLNQSKWSATWNVIKNPVFQQFTTQSPWNYCGRENLLYFDILILIDLTPSDSVISIKKGSTRS
jgi:hypothetical protein